MNVGDKFVYMMIGGSMLFLTFERVDMFGDYEFIIDPSYQDCKSGSIPPHDIHLLIPIEVWDSPLMKALK